MTTRFVGYDRSGYPVYSMPNGYYFTAANQVVADRLADFAPRTGMPPSVYNRRYGPITKEKP